MLQMSCKSVQIFRNPETIMISNDGLIIEYMDQSHIHLAVLVQGS